MGGGKRGSGKQKILEILPKGDSALGGKTKQNSRGDLLKAKTEAEGDGEHISCRLLNDIVTVLR